MRTLGTTIEKKCRSFLFHYYIGICTKFDSNSGTCVSLSFHSRYYWSTLGRHFLPKISVTDFLKTPPPKGKSGDFRTTCGSADFLGITLRMSSGIFKQNTITYLLIRIGKQLLWDWASPGSVTSWIYDFLLLKTRICGVIKENGYKSRDGYIPPVLVRGFLRGRIFCIPQIFFYQS